MAVGDVYVTATFMLVLATTLIIGNIIADMLLALLDPRVRLGVEARNDRHDRDGDHPAARQPQHHQCALRPWQRRLFRPLVWRRFRRSIMGMIGLIMVIGLLLMALFADFVAPVDPRANGIGFAPPRPYQLHRAGRLVQPSAAHLSDRRDGRARLR